jgi:uncharacterized membrane protein
MTLSGLGGAALTFVALIDSKLAAGIVAVAGASYLGGRMAGILTGLELGFRTVEISLIICCLNTCWLLLALPLFQMVSRRIDPPGFLRSVFGRAKQRAKTTSRWLDGAGVLGLAVFVWLPFPFTGAFAGALVGLLMGIPLRRLVPVLLVSMWIGVATWTLGFEALYLVEGTAGRISAWLLTIGLVAVSVVLQLCDRQREETG